MGDVGHGLGVYWGTLVGSASWVCSTLKDSLRSFITFSICSVYSFKKKLDLYLSTVPE